MCYKWVESVFRHMYSTFSHKKKVLVIQTGWNVTLFSRPVAAPPSNRATYTTFAVSNIKYTMSRDLGRSFGSDEHTKEKKTGDCLIEAVHDHP